MPNNRDGFIGEAHYWSGDDDRDFSPDDDDNTCQRCGGEGVYHDCERRAWTTSVQVSEKVFHPLCSACETLVLPSPPVPPQEEA